MGGWRAVLTRSSSNVVAVRLRAPVVFAPCTVSNLYPFLASDAAASHFISLITLSFIPLAVGHVSFQATPLHARTLRTPAPLHLLTPPLFTRPPSRHTHSTPNSLTAASAAKLRPVPAESQPWTPDPPVATFQTSPLPRTHIMHPCLLCLHSSRKQPPLAAARIATRRQHPQQHDGPLHHIVGDRAALPPCPPPSTLHTLHNTNCPPSRPARTARRSPALRDHGPLPLDLCLGHPPLERCDSHSCRGLQPGGVAAAFGGGQGRPPAVNLRP